VGFGRQERGAASVEHAALVLLAAAVAIVAVAAAGLAGDDDPTPDLASALLRKQRCAVRYPDPCWRDPLTEAYGRRIAGAVRALAPAPAPVQGLVGVDYRRCRQVRCAIPLPGERGAHLTISNRRTVAYTALDSQDASGGLLIHYWLYRPSLGWELINREVGADQLAALASTTLPESADPRLIPLETLLGRDEAHFAAGEEPPWREKIESRWGRGRVSMSAPVPAEDTNEGVRWQTSRP
jgi:hypothetical protein